MVIFKSLLSHQPDFQLKLMSLVDPWAPSPAYRGLVCSERDMEMLLEVAGCYHQPRRTQTELLFTLASPFHLCSYDPLKATLANEAAATVGALLNGHKGTGAPPPSGQYLVSSSITQFPISTPPPPMGHSHPSFSCWKISPTPISHFNTRLQVVLRVPVAVVDDAGVGRVESDALPSSTC